MYAEADFLLALIKDDDWLADPAEEFYEAHRDDLWTSQYALVELMLVAYRENWNVLRVVANTNSLLEVRGDVEPVLAAASYVEDDEFTPFDALHLVHSESDPIVSTDDSYEEFSGRIAFGPET